ncbi:MAG TPA: hypothetical protein VJN64_16205 [Terriglobales bacterium]|nr:hypothetical protein [Terriglobales bacterium]
MRAKNFQVPQPIAHAEFVIGLQLVTMASPADTFQVFPAVRIPGSEFPDKPSRHNVVYMPARAGFAESYAAGHHFTISA